MKSLAEVIKETAHQLGYALAGITTIETPPHMAAYEKWLSLGRHASMGYLAGEQAVACRRDPLLLLPVCKSILVLAAAYPDPNSATTNISPFPGRVASYAWGRDYHVLLEEKNRELIAFIENQTGTTITHRQYTDTGPILERELAQRAGLGWIGKNTCLINPNLGSYLFLSEILLGLELDPDPPFTPDRCGRCTRCIEACPTGCILPNRTLDAGRCISYLTIENKGKIPVELRSNMGNWIFGCDECQIVCPWNRFAGNSNAVMFRNLPGINSPDLVQESTLSPDDFDSQFKETPMRRSKRIGYLRNVAVALGNSRDKRALPGLRTLEKDPNILVRDHARWAIDNITTL